MKSIPRSEEDKNMEKLPILYSFRRCPYAMRARMALLLNNVAVQLREVVLKDKPSSLLAYSPKGTVPVLVSVDEFVIEESREIIDWAIQQSASPAFDLACPDQQLLIEKNDNLFKENLDKYKYFDRYPEYSQEYYREQGEHFLAQLEQHLTHQPYLFGQQISYADIAIFPFIRQFAGVEKDWFANSKYTQLRQWLNVFLNSEQFKTIMFRFSPWRENDELVQFPPQANAS